MRMVLTKAERKFLSECSKRGHESMTPEARKERARKAAKARWDRKVTEQATPPPTTA